MSNELDLLQGTLDVLVLRALSHGPRHGYAIAQWIQDNSDGTFRILDGALYTSLHRMEEKGWAEAEWGTSDRGKRARFYELTPAGRAELTARTTRWERYVNAVAHVMSAPAPA